MTTLLLESALLPHGWASNVRLHINQEGVIESLEQDVLSSDGEVLTGCALPGIPNVHSHAQQRAMVGLAEKAAAGGDDFWSWRSVMYTCLERMQPEHLQAIAAQLYVEMLKFGYTNVAEFQYLHHDPEGKPYANRAEMSLRVLAAAQQAGIGITLLPVLYRYSGFGAKPSTPRQRRFINDGDQFLTIVSALRQAVAGSPLAMVGIAPHSLRAVSPELLNDVLQGFGGRGPVHIHIAEQVAEVDACVDWSGQRPVAWLLDRVDVNQNWCLVHATHIEQTEIAAIAGSGAVAGLCPTTEANLGDGIFPAQQYLALGGRFGVGSDSQVSVSPAQELRLLEYTQRLTHRQRNVLAPRPLSPQGPQGPLSTGRSLFTAALSGGAQACGQKIGQLAPGYRADLVVLGRDHPRLAERGGDALLDSWIFACDDNPVRDVWVAGQAVVVGGRHILESEIEAEFRTAINELKL